MGFSLIACTLSTYLIGAISGAMIAGRVHRSDLTKKGSGNLGATNVARNLGAKWGVAVLFFDFFKALFALGLASMFLEENALVLPGAAVVLGHCYSVFGGFKGGKGIATGAGVLGYFSPLLLLAVLAIFAVIFYSTRIVSLSSLIACGAATLYAVGNSLMRTTNLSHLQFSQIPWCEHGLSALMSFLMAMILFKHRANIKRLTEGTEPKLSFGKSVTS